MAFFDELIHATEAERQAFLAIPVLSRGVRGEISRESYLTFLGQAYHHVKHTVPLLMACGTRLPERLAWLRVAIAKYIEEETGHEEWVLNDIEAAGGDRVAASRSQPHPATELMVAYAYDTVQRGNPVGFFGMVLVLEGTSVRLAGSAAKAIRAALQLPEQAFSYLSSHGALDLDHMEFFRSLMNRLDDPADQGAVIHCARMMYKLYGDIFRAIDSSDQFDVRGAA